MMSDQKVPPALQGEPDGNKLAIGGRIITFCLRQTFGEVLHRVPNVFINVILFEYSTNTKIACIANNTRL